ncbi:MAG: hypothetical protein QOC96_149 [Acidobacteriota bacterium]|jgi:hypothetical protein|nr:hypothetical protein [Acidobacteriota bacterium]
MAILFWLFVIFIVVGGLFYIVAVIAGVGHVIKAKKNGVSLKEQSLANAVAQANKMMEKRKAKEIRRGYAPNVQVEVRVVQAAPKDETPEQRDAREKAEARKRYLESLVDK